MQWRNAKETTAKILSAEEQWVRRGSGNINLDIEYSVNGKMRRGTASVAPSRLKDGNVTEINVYYMTNKPERVIPVDVLKTKQRDIYIAAIVGVGLTLLGVVLNRRKGSSDAATTIQGPTRTND